MYHNFMKKGPTPNDFKYKHKLSKPYKHLSLRFKQLVDFIAQLSIPKHVCQRPWWEY